MSPYAGSVMTVLMTGFEPFAGDSSNPSGEAVHLAAALWEGPEVLVTAVLPVTFDGAASVFEELLTRHQPQVVIAVGLAGGRSTISVERVAVNLVDARIPDNDGAQPIDESSIADAPAAVFSSLPVKAIAHELSAAGIPSSLSTTAGTFVCNHIFYRAATWARRGSDRKAGFIHVPWATGQSTSEPELPLADIARALNVAMRTSIDNDEDRHSVGGSLS